MCEGLLYLSPCGNIACRCDFAPKCETNKSTLVDTGVVVAWFWNWAKKWSTSPAAVAALQPSYDPRLNCTSSRVVLHPTVSQQVRSIEGRQIFARVAFSHETAAALKFTLRHSRSVPNHTVPPRLRAQLAVLRFPVLPVPHYPRTFIRVPSVRVPWSCGNVCETEPPVTA